MSLWAALKINKNKAATFQHTPRWGRVAGEKEMCFLGFDKSLLPGLWRQEHSSATASLCLLSAYLLRQKFCVNQWDLLFCVCGSGAMICSLHSSCVHFEISILSGEKNLEEHGGEKESYLLQQNAPLDCTTLSHAVQGKERESRLKSHCDSMPPIFLVTIYVATKSQCLKQESHGGFHTNLPSTLF